MKEKTKTKELLKLAVSNRKNTGESDAETAVNVAEGIRKWFEFEFDQSKSE